jgi:hypothetical protein
MPGVDVLQDVIHLVLPWFRPRRYPNPVVNVLVHASEAVPCAVASFPVNSLCQILFASAVCLSRLSSCFVGRFAVL